MSVSSWMYLAPLVRKTSLEEMFQTIKLLNSEEKKWLSMWRSTQCWENLINHLSKHGILYRSSELQNFDLANVFKLLANINPPPPTPLLINNYIMNGNIDNIVTYRTRETRIIV